MKTLKKHFRLLVVLMVLLAVSGGAALYYLKTSRSETASHFRSWVGGVLHIRNFPACPKPGEGLEVIQTTRYVNNEVFPGDTFQNGKDNKLIMETADKLRLFDYATGYYADLPLGTTFEFTLSPKFTSFHGEGYSGVISREWSVGDDVSEYVNYYFSRFMLDEGYQTENKVLVTENVKDPDRERLSLALEEADGDYDAYTYLVFKTGSRYFFRVMVKYNRDDPQMETIIQELADSFYYFKPKGKAVYDLDWYPAIPDNWSEETRALYDRIRTSDGILWGLFADDMFKTGINERIPTLEETLDHRFEVVLAYIPLTADFPTAFMQQCHAEGRTVELTYQLTFSNNEYLYARSPVIAMRRGDDLEPIRAFARDATAFGHPFLFRLNNEMNSDWTSYGGVINLQDPDIYAENWRTVYEIFQEEGATNAIWIFNPHDRDYPPNNWNSALAYYPGNEYVHMFGVTGYNNGTYYREVTGESWREFDVIMDSLVKGYDGLFDRFPWIMTEFASSSIGGDKAGWISRMFTVLPRYPNLKVAVWFSSADYDYRPEFKGEVSRPYWLDETPETLEAFRKGLLD